MANKLVGGIVLTYFVLLFIVVACVCLPIACLLFVFSFWWDKNRALMHKWSCFWGSTLIWLNPFWRLRALGLNNFQKGRRYLIVANHQSILDILAGYRLFKPFKWVSKAEVFKWPVVGWNLSMSGYIKLTRGSVGGQRKMIRECCSAIENGVSVMLFPEGTRSKTGEINRFKDGAFFIAKQTKVDILPVVIDGTLNALHQAGRITLKMLPAIPYDSFKDLAEGEIAATTQQIMTEALAELRNNKQTNN